MKILYYSPHPNLFLDVPAGPGVHMREIIAGFESLGHTVKPVILGGLEQPVSTMAEGRAAVNKKGGIKHAVKRILPNTLWQTLKDFQLKRFDRHAGSVLEEAIEGFKPDLIYERGYYGMTSGVSLAQKHSIPHYLEMNAPYPEERVAMEGKSLLSRWAKRQEAMQISLTRQLVVVSSALASYLKGIDPTSSEKICITPNAIRAAFSPPSKDEIQALRTSLELGDGPVIGFVGSIFPYHGVDKLIHAFGALATDFPSAKLLIVGDGAVLPSLKALAKEKRIQHRIVFTGKVTHASIFQHIGVMDICVMATSNWYGSPVKIFEYGAMEKAIIAPDVGPVKDVMVHGEHGLLVQPEPRELQRAMVRLLEDKQLRDRLARRFHQKVMDEHTWQRMSAAILEKMEVSS